MASESTASIRQHAVRLVASHTLTFLLAVLASLLGLVTTTPAVYSGLLVVMFAACTLTLGGMVLTIGVSEFYLALRAQRVATDAGRSLSTLVRFVSRVDSVVIEDNERVKFSWLMRIECDPEDSIQELYFPINIDLDEEGRDLGRRVQVDSIVVNGEPKPADKAYVPKQTRLFCDPGESKYPMEYGIIRVPVGLGPSRRRVDVAVEMTLTACFPELETREFVLVDIPYVTRRLTVNVRAKAGMVQSVKGPLGHEVEAWSQIMEVFDGADSSRRAPEVESFGDRIAWRSEFPKLGYRYKIWFRVPSGA